MLMCSEAWKRIKTMELTKLTVRPTDAGTRIVKWKTCCSSIERRFCAIAHHLFGEFLKISSAVPYNAPWSYAMAAGEAKNNKHSIKFNLQMDDRAGRTGRAQMNAVIWMKRKHRNGTKPHNEPLTKEVAQIEIGNEANEHKRQKCQVPINETVLPPKIRRHLFWFRTVNGKSTRNSARGGTFALRVKCYGNAWQFEWQTASDSGT